MRDLLDWTLVRTGGFVLGLVVIDELADDEHVPMPPHHTGERLNRAFDWVLQKTSETFALASRKR